MATRNRIARLSTHWLHPSRRTLICSKRGTDLIHIADGELSRKAPLHASMRCGLETLSVKESGVFEGASRDER
jgi:hypothetical protein